MSDKAFTVAVISNSCFIISAIQAGVAEENITVIPFGKEVNERGGTKAITTFLEKASDNKWFRNIDLVVADGRFNFELFTDQRLTKGELLLKKMREAGKSTLLMDYCDKTRFREDASGGFAICPDLSTGKRRVAEAVVRICTEQHNQNKKSTSAVLVGELQRSLVQWFSWSDGK